MEPFENLLLFIGLLGTILILEVVRLRAGSSSIKGKMRNAKKAPWDLQEFLSLNPSNPRRNDIYRFNEESVRSHAHRYVGRFDGAILHWEEVPILDMIIENKFPVSFLPEKVKGEDIFQAGLYALALVDTGVSCSNANLVIIYCLQDAAKKCLHGNSPKKCWDCRDGKIFSKKFDQRKIMKDLAKLNAVWYKKRNPRANPSEENCRPCPFSKNGKCNYSAI
ncbi:hypothetical protein EU528_14285 [Candidatus Thorarchaeota archaeon]|nr:MAG: hypothetical protein EU528_14285 [Candidatus Thorarchaeota archaeon]